MTVIVGGGIAKEEEKNFKASLKRFLSSKIKIAVGFITCDSEFSPTTVESREKDRQCRLLDSFSKWWIYSNRRVSQLSVKNDDGSGSSCILESATF